ncbi:MAG: tyrosinase family protein [Mesorhizobium sp.]|nr:MAG: tyrosinase family protein [Mesorhizobium sp.]
MSNKLAAIVLSTVLGVMATIQIGFADDQELRVRKNIDALTHEELSNYLHALDIVMHRDPTTVGSYAYYAALHNDPNVGPCEHFKDSFLPWHRAHLYDFETALRASDPPRTSNLTIPYWNWSELPSGQRFPKVFENEALLNRDREKMPICTGSPDPTCQRLPYPWHYLDTKVLSVPSWSSPVNPNFGSFSSNQAVECRDRLGGGYGALEEPPHNTMHSAYIGGLMGNPSTAAEDPIFWSYHAFIDLLWWNWQQRPNHTVDTCLTCKLCGLNWTVAQVVNSEKQLKVSYDFTPPAPPPATIAAEGAMPEPLASVDLALGATEDFVGRRTTLVTIPAKPVTVARAAIQNVRISSPITFQVNAFFYPQSEAATFDPKDRATRERSIVYVGTIWQSHDDHATRNALTQSFSVDLTSSLNALVAQHGGETWVLDVRTYVDPKSEGMHGLTMDVRAAQTLLEFGGVGLSIE